MINQRTIPKSGEFYRHFKNKLYQIVTVAEHSETGERLVIYQALYGEFRIYARPLDMFLSKVDAKKYPNAMQIYRFEPIDSEDIQTQEALHSLPIMKDEPKQEISPLMEFLDAKDHQGRLDVLVKYKEMITDEMMDSMSLSMDCVLNGHGREERYYELIKYIQMKAQYEKSSRI